MPRLTKSKSIITNRLFRVESGLKAQNELLSSFLLACRMRARSIYILRIFQHPNPSCPFFWFLETISQVLIMQAKTREISSPTGSVWSCTEVHAQHIHTGIYAAALFGLILITHNRIFFSWLVILWYLQAEEDKTSCIFKCAVRARLVRVIALNQLLGMPKLLCIILYFQIKNNWKDHWKKSIFLRCYCSVFHHEL